MFIMPRGVRLDCPGAVHHLIVRGIERRRIFRSDGDRQRFVDRLDDLCARMAAHFGVSGHEISGASLRRRVVAARAVLCQLAGCRHGFSLSTLARRLSISRTSVARAVERAAAVYAEYGCRPTDFLQD